ncbi:MAG: Soluble lytic murein transglycosylase precursor [Candidatus Atribacteria bacterium ADurb.Bin276]|uniref:Soluble lytic murein transglycosylase n=1 Tax=Candidatus Atribacter allofermentans TaxID=1852833 RepID=A0A1V5SWK5_9BACT|nr:MAG: Soluble lytic murein transglycosylase precursor [Candidatus Atribacteria bacterium ADurb.Bin276]
MRNKIHDFIVLIVIIIFLLGAAGNVLGKDDFLSELINNYRQKDYQKVINQINNHPDQAKHYANQTALLKLQSLLTMEQLEKAYEFLLKEEKNRQVSISDHLWSLYLDALINQKRTNSIEDVYHHLQSLSTLSILLHRSAWQVAELFNAEKNYNQAINYYIESLSCAYDESERLNSLIGISKILVGKGNFLEALFHTKKIYYSHRTMTSRQARDLINPIVDKLNPEDFSMKTRLEVAAFFFQLGWTSDSIRFLDQIDLNSLLSSEILEYWILWLRIYLRQENLTDMKRILTQNYMLMDHPDGWFYTGVYHQRRGEYSLASIAYENLLNQFPNSEYVLNTFKNLSFCYRVLDDEENYLNILDRRVAAFPYDSEPIWEKFWYLYQKKDLNSAQSALDLLSTYPDEKSRALFWKYKIDQSEESIRYLEEIIKNEGLDYYYVRAWQELGKTNKPLPSSRELFPPHEFITKMEIFTQNQKIHWNRYLILSDLSLKTNAEAELLTLKRLMPNHPEIYFELSRFYARNQEYRESQINAIYFQNRYPDFKNYKNVWKKIYPDYYFSIIKDLSEQNSIDPYLVLALIKAESAFEIDIVSPVGAVGLMQLMPSTAAWMIETGMNQVVNFADWNDSFLINPEINLELGATYFRYLLDYFNQKICPAIVAYNAGPGRLDEWIKGENQTQPDSFIENIPIPETKNYIKKVINFYFLYSMIYTGQFKMSPCTF